MMLLALLVLSQKPADVESLKRTAAVESAAVERSPDDTEALYRLGLTYVMLGEMKKAIKPLETLLEKDSDSLDGKLLLARAYRFSGDVDKAKDLLDKAILAQPDESSLRAERGLLARSTDDIETAVKEYQKAVELTPKDAKLVFNLGEAMQKSGSRLDQAIALYRQAIELDGTLTDAKVNLGKALAEKGLFSEAKEVLASVNKETMTDSEAHYNLGVILMRENNVTAAVTEFERTLAINPKHAQALNNLGVAMDARAEDKKALEYFKKAAAAEPTFAEAFFNQGMSYIKLQKPNDATRAFEQALKLEPASSGPYVKLGTLYLQQGKRDRAVEAFKKAVNAQEAAEKDASAFKMLKKRFDSERNTDAYRGLALALLQQGKVDEAVSTLKRAVEKMPKDPSARVALGEALLAQGKADEAVEQFKERLSLEPTTDARLDLARAYTRKHSAKAAEPLYREVLKTEPGNRQANIGLVDLYIAMGRLGEAEILLKKLMTEDSSDAAALARFGIMKSRFGRPNEALEPLAAAVKLNPGLTDARAEYAFLLVRADTANADRCVKTMSDILTDDPRNVLALTYLGFCLYTTGDKVKAETSLKSAIAVDGDSGSAHYYLGQVLEGVGRKDEARKEYEAAAKLDFADAKELLKTLK